MTITIDYSDTAPQYVIKIPRNDLQLVQSVPTEIRQININSLRLTLNDLMDDVEGMPYPTNHVHTAPLTVAGVTLARVVNILSPYVIEFEDGNYNVNVVGGNSNLSDVALKNQVGLNTANSAGLQDPFALQAAAFGSGEVSIDVNSGISGTVFPTGTRAFPVNNISDGVLIARERGIKTFRILSTMSISTNDFSNGFLFFGDNPNIGLTLNDLANFSNCEFKNLTIDGTLDGSNSIRDCAIRDINYFNGYIFQCGFLGTVTLGGTNTATFLQCFSLVAGGDAGQFARIDLGGIHETPLVIRDWQGGLEISNCSDSRADVSIDMSSGRVLFKSDISDGVYVIRGSAQVIDNSVGSAIIEDQTLNMKLSELHQMRGLDPNNPVTVTPSREISGTNIDIEITGDGTTTSTATRQ